MYTGPHIHIYNIPTLNSIYTTLPPRTHSTHSHSSTHALTHTTHTHTLEVSCYHHKHSKDTPTIAAVAQQTQRKKQGKRDSQLLQIRLPYTSFTTHTPSIYKHTHLILTPQHTRTQHTPIIAVDTRTHSYHTTHTRLLC